jgi:hypothetical protein
MKNTYADLVVVADKSWLHGTYTNGEINTSLPYIAVTKPDFFEQGENADEFIEEIFRIWIKSDLTQEEAFNKWVDYYLIGGGLE